MMRPYSYNFPAECLKPFIRVGIALPVGYNLITPEVGVLLRPRAMLRAAVPEAPVHENGDALAGKDYICHSARPFDQWEM